MPRPTLALALPSQAHFRADSALTSPVDASQFAQTATSSSLRCSCGTCWSLRPPTPSLSPSNAPLTSSTSVGLKTWIANEALPVVSEPVLGGGIQAVVASTALYVGCSGSTSATRRLTDGLSPHPTQHHRLWCVAALQPPYTVVPLTLFSTLALTSAAEIIPQCVILSGGLKRNDDLADDTTFLRQVHLHALRPARRCEGCAAHQVPHPRHVRALASFSGVLLQR